MPSNVSAPMTSHVPAPITNMVSAPMSSIVSAPMPSIVSAPMANKVPAPMPSIVPAPTSTQSSPVYFQAIDPQQTYYIQYQVVPELPYNTAASPTSTELSLATTSCSEGSPCPSLDTASTSSFSSSASEISPKPEKKKRVYKNYAKVRVDNNAACERYRQNKKKRENAKKCELKMLKEQNEKLNKRYKE